MSEHLTVNLTDRSVAAMHAAERMTGDTPTDLTNRALQVYAALVEIGQHEGRYRLNLDVGGRPLYVVAGRTEQPRKRWWQW